MTDRPPAPAALALTLFGGFQARLASGAPVRLAMKKAQALLAYLALSGGRPRPRGALAALLWGVATDHAARNSLRQTLFALRRALPETAAGALTIETGSVTLDPAAVESDVVEFERAIAAGTPPALERAVALYRGELLEGFDLRAPAFDAWLGAERERLRGLVGQALGGLLAHHTAAGALGRAIECAQRGLALDPLDEALHRALMELHARDGRHAAALRQYQICLEVLARELGVEPEPATRELYQRLLQRRGAPVEAPLAHAGAPGIDTPIVGRAAEITRLREALDRAWAGLGAVVALVGEAGIGKTRLARELAAEAERRGGRVLVGACHEAERILPFRPWIDALRTGGVTEPDPPAADRPQGFFDALVQLLLGLAVRQPLVLVLEDLHWADEMSVRFLSFLVHHLPAAVLVALTVRDEDLADAPLLRQLLAQLDREQSLTRIALPPLGRSDTQSLVHALARAGTAATAVSRLARQVWTASEGNPFVVVEMMRAVEQGTPAPAAGAPGLPEKVQELIAGRLDRLGVPAQQLASVAAVIGHAFDWALVERAAGLGERATAEGVEELVRRRVLQPDGERFDFAHDRIRAVAYERLLPPRRKLLHRQVAEAIEALHARDFDRHAATLGLHYRRAEHWERALGHLRAAGAAAFWRGGHREAATCFEEALECLRHLPTTPERLEQAIDIRFDLRHALVPIAEFGRIGRHLREAERLAARLGDRARLGQLAAFLAHCHWWFGEHQRAVETCQQALQTARELGDAALGLSAGMYLGLARQALGDHREAADLFRSIVAAIDGARIPDPSLGAALTGVYARAYLAMSLAELGEFAEGAARAQEALSLAEGLRHPFALAQAFIATSSVAIRKGEFEGAPFERYRAFRRTADVGDVWPLADWYLGYAHALAGRVGDALPLLEEVVQPTSSVVGVVGRSLLSAWLAETYLLAGRRDDALFLAAQAVELAREHGEHGHEAWVVHLLGDLAAAGSPPDAEAAERHYQQAAALAAELGMRPLAAQCRLSLGLLYRTLGRRTEARGELAAAVEELRALGMRLWLTRAEAALADL